MTASTTDTIAVLRIEIGDIEPLIWLYEFKDSWRHPFMFRKALELPPQTVIRGVAAGATIFLIPERTGARK